VAGDQHKKGEMVIGYLDCLYVLVMMSDDCIYIKSESFESSTKIQTYEKAHFVNIHHKLNY